MSTEEDKALLRRFRDAVYSQVRLDSIEEFVLDDVIAHEPDGDVRGVEEVKRYLATYLAARRCGTATTPWLSCNSWEAAPPPDHRPSRTPP